MQTPEINYKNTSKVFKNHTQKMWDASNDVEMLIFNLKVHLNETKERFVKVLGYINFVCLYSFYEW